MTANKQGLNKDSSSTPTTSAVNSSPLSFNASTFIIKGRKRALREAYNRTVSVKHSCYSITGDELVRSYKPFLPLLRVRVYKHGGSSSIITNVEKESFQAIKDLTDAGAQIRHVDISSLRRCVIYDDSIAYFSIVEPVITHGATENVDQTEGDDFWVGSTEPSVVQSAKKHFLSDWKNAIPAEQKIREIEEGIGPVRTRLLENQDEIIREIIRKNNAANKLSICSAFGGMQMSYKYLFDSYKNVIDKHRKQGGEGMRWIINIHKEETVKLVKIFLDAGIQIRHLKNMPPMNFGVSDKEMAITVGKMKNGELSHSFLMSNELLYVNQFNSLFEELWKNGIDAKDRIKDIEEGVDTDIEIVPNAATARGLCLDLITNARTEVMLMFPTGNDFIRQEKMGVIQSLKNAADRRNIKARILMPADSLTKDIVRDLKQNYHNKIGISYFQQASATKATILVVDRRISLVMDLRDDSKTTFDEAIGQSTYSHSKAGVLSYVAIFENLWAETELYESINEGSVRLELANEQLKIQD